MLMVASVFYSLFYPTPYLRQVLRDVPVVVVDRDHTPMSRKFARWLDASEGVAVAGQSADLEAAQEAVRAGKAGGVVLIAAGLRAAHPATRACHRHRVCRWQLPAGAKHGVLDGQYRRGELRCGHLASAPPGTPGELAAVQSDRRIRHLPRAGRLHSGAAADAAHRDGHPARGAAAQSGEPTPGRCGPRSAGS